MSVLFETNWATATGHTDDAIDDGGYFDKNSHREFPGSYSDDWYEVINDSSAPGGRNFLRIANASTTSAGPYICKFDVSMGNPSAVYVRFWYRLRGGTTIGEHILFLRHDTNYGNNLNCPTLVYMNQSQLTFCPYYDHQFMLSAASRTTLGLDDGGWHRREVKISGAGGSSGSVEVRVDGVDITSSLYLVGDASHTLSSHNGSLSMNAINYVEFQVYNHASYLGELVDIAGYKIITDGWIGRGKVNGVYSGMITKCCGVATTSVKKINGVSMWP